MSWNKNMRRDRSGNWHNTTKLFGGVTEGDTIIVEDRKAHLCGGYWIDEEGEVISLTKGQTARVEAGKSGVPMVINVDDRRLMWVERPQFRIIERNDGFLA